MNFKSAAIAVAAAATLGLSACATTGYPSTYGTGYPTTSYPSQHQGYGTIQDVSAVTLNGSIGLGTVGGAIIGGAVGSQIGDGNGQKLATIGGAIAGGLIGREVEQRHNTPATGQRITVRLDNGYNVTVVQPGYSFRRGDRVVVSGTGSNARVTYR